MRMIQFAHLVISFLQELWTMLNPFESRDIGGQDTRITDSRKGI